MKYRALRVSKLIGEELSKIIIRELEFPGAIVTITDVEVSKKLEAASVKLSVVPSSKKGGSLAIAQKATGKLQHLLTKKINIKPMPKIHFEIDHGSENAAVVEKRFLEERRKNK